MDSTAASRPQTKARVRRAGVAPQLRAVTEHQTANATRTIATRALPGGLVGEGPTNIRPSSLRVSLRCPVVGVLMVRSVLSASRPRYRTS